MFISSSMGRGDDENRIHDGRVPDNRAGVSHGKIYQIANQDYAGLADHAARAVKLTGSLAGDTIKVSHIVMTEERKGH